MDFLIVRCVEGHEYEIDDSDDKIRRQGYTRCPERGCLRNAWAVKNITCQTNNREKGGKLK